MLTLAGYVGIAIENATLYRSLQRKVEEYERLKEFSENIVESINVGILAADLEDRVESWNTQIEQLTGITREQALGKQLARSVPGGAVRQFDRVRGETGIHHIYKFVLKPAVAAVAPSSNGNGNGHGNGHGPAARLSEATLNIAIAPLVSKDQEQIGRLIIFDDVTDRAELEQRLVQADKLSSIGLLAAGVAHEVNTPLAVISTYAQMLAKQVAEDSQKSLILEKIAKQTFRASEIVNSLLNFSRTSTTSFGGVSLNKVVQETLSLLEHQFTKAGIQLKTDLDPDAAAGARQRRQAAAGLPESLPERARRHGHGRHAGSPLLGGRPGRARGSLRHRPRHRAGESPPHLRSVLHHQGRQEGHRPRTFGDVRYHSRAWRLDRSLQPARRRRHVPCGTSPGRPRLGKETGNRRINDRSADSSQPGPKGKILVIDDELDIREGLYDLLTIEGGYTVELAQNGTEGLHKLEAPPTTWCCSI